MFGIESTLNYLHKLAISTTTLGCQIAFCHSTYMDLSVKKVNYSRQLFEHQGPLNEHNYLDHQVVDDFRKDFDCRFSTYFNTYPDSSAHFFFRYQCGLYVFHSVAYSRRGESSSFNVTIFNSSSSKSPAGEILFFFRYKNSDYLFLRQFEYCRTRVSSLVGRDPRVPTWSERIDNFYSLVRTNIASLIIYPCSRIKNKCLFFPFDEDLNICTEIEHELEHD